MVSFRKPLVTLDNAIVLTTPYLVLAHDLVVTLHNPIIPADKAIVLTHLCFVFAHNTVAP